MITIGLVVLAVAVACTVADVSHVVKNDDYLAPIVRSSFESQPEDNFYYAYETGNGIVSQVDGVVKNSNSENAAFKVKGSVRYTAPDGTPVSLEYVADENGYHPTKFLIVFAVAVACAAADVSHIVKNDEYLAPIVRSSFESQPEGNFQYAYETGNGIVSQVDGVVKNPNSENAALEVKGSVRYTAPDGTPVSLEYVADENGYHPTGSHIPVPPPIPELILRSLQYIEAHPAPLERVVKKTF